MSRKWSEADDGTVLRILGKHTDMAAALSELSALFGQRTTRDAVNHRLRSQGLGSAHDNLAGAGRKVVPIRERATGELERVLFIPDCHHPYVDVPAWQLMLKAAREFAPHRIVILGDFGDFYVVSDHEKTPGKRSTLEEEFAAQNAALDEVDALGAKHKHFLEGNHEYRLKRHYAKNSPETYNLVTVQKELRLNERGWQFTPYFEHLRIGKLMLAHDVGFAGVNAVRMSRARFEGNAVIGHVHRMGVHYEGNAAGESHVGACFGWLGDRKSLAVGYTSSAQKARDWQLGFGIGYLEPCGSIHLQAVPIVGGRCVVNGKLLQEAA